MCPAPRPISANPAVTGSQPGRCCGRIIRLATLLLVLTLQACAWRVVPPPPAPDATLPVRVELSDTPFHPQRRYQCGPAALATVLQASGVSVDPDALTPEVYLPGRRGSLQAELIAATRSRGRIPYPLESSLDTVLREVAAGRPVLVFQNLGLDAIPYWHFAVVIGYDLDRGVLLLRSGIRARKEQTLAVFERTWRRGGRWALVVTTPDSIPDTATMTEWIAVIRDIERLGQETNATIGYTQASQRWPNQALPLLALANLQYARGQFTEARSSLLEATQRAPGAHAAWNNLAVALQASDCRRQAALAASCAVSLAPRVPGYRAVLQDAYRGTAPESAAACPRLPGCPVAAPGWPDP